MSGQGYEERNRRTRAVSTVIGVVLMVGIVVVLAGAVSVFAFGFGGQTNEPAPSFSYTTDYNDTTGENGEYVNFTHEAGETIDTATITIRVQGAVARDKASPSTTTAVTYAVDGGLNAQVGEQFASGEVFSVNKSAFEEKGTGSTLGSGVYLDLSEAEVKFVWTPPESEGRSEVLFTWQGPDF